MVTRSAEEDRSPRVRSNGRLAEVGPTLSNDERHTPREITMNDTMQHLLDVQRTPRSLPSHSTRHESPPVAERL